MSETFQIDEVLTISDLETLKVVSDPLRMRILVNIGLANELGQLRTVKQIAAELDVPPAKLYYHINLLEKHGLVRVAETQVVSGIIEKHYQITAYNFTIDRELLTAGINKDEKAEALMALLDSTLDAVRADLLRLVRAMTDVQAAGGPDIKHARVTRENAWLTPEQAQDFNTRLAALMEELRRMSSPEGGERKAYTLTVVYMPVVGL